MQVAVLTKFLMEFAFMDEKISAQYALNEHLFGFIAIVEQNLQIKKDRIRMEEQYDEGLKYLINVYEVYKTPLDHFQGCFERVCKYIRKELL
mmetsp:Transcript_21041/g.15418  ORF Transcript_21041/g.15418 Transcript_21041/m.15418 type:complete len:92 (+) Transcript_21041:653-928(+)